MSNLWDNWPVLPWQSWQGAMDIYRPLFVELEGMSDPQLPCHCGRWKLPFALECRRCLRLHIVMRKWFLHLLEPTNLDLRRIKCLLNQWRMLQYPF